MNTLYKSMGSFIFGYGAGTGVVYPLKVPIALATYDANSVGAFALTPGKPVVATQGTMLHRIIVLSGGTGVLNFRSVKTNAVVLAITLQPADYPYLPWTVEMGPNGLYFPFGFGCNATAGGPVVQLIYNNVRTNG